MISNTFGLKKRSWKTCEFTQPKMFFRPFFFYASPLVLMTPFLVVVLWLLIKTLKDVFFKNSRPGKSALDYNNHSTIHLQKKRKKKEMLDAFALFLLPWFDFIPLLFFRFEHQTTSTNISHCATTILH